LSNDGRASILAVAMMIRRNRNLLVHLLSLALLLAQLGMVAHASTHLKVDPHGAPVGQLCGECLSFAPLQNIVGGAPTAVVVTPAPRERATEIRASREVPTCAFSAFRSRAPPQLL